MPIYGRYYSPRDIKLFTSLNNELLSDIIQCVVTIFKISPTDTPTNVYGESDSEIGKLYYPGVNVVTLVDKDDITSDSTEFGPDRSQNSVFKFKRSDLVNVNLYPEISDLVLYNSRYYSIDNVIEEQLLGSIPDKTFSVVVHTHYTRLSSINLTVRNI